MGAAVRHLLYKGMAPQEASKSIFGIDKDSYLVRLALSRISLATLTEAQVYCADSLSWSTENNHPFPLSDYYEAFDVVLTNPPFGAKIVAASPEVQASFDLGHKWKYGAKAGRYSKTSYLQSSVPPQVFFMERCLSLVRPGGRVGMVVPESLVSNKGYRHVMQYLRDRADILAVIGMPEALFKTSERPERILRRAY